jgi:hypothetical protein
MFRAVAAPLLSGAVQPGWINFATFLPTPSQAIQKHEKVAIFNARNFAAAASKTTGREEVNPT